MKANTKLQDAIRVFVKVPMAYEASGATKEERNESRRRLEREWAERFWSAFEHGVGVRLWQTADPNACGDEATAAIVDIKEFVASLAHKVDLYGKLSFWAGKISGYRAIWAQRFAKLLFDQGIRDEDTLVRYSYAYMNSIKAIRAIIRNAREDAPKKNSWETAGAQAAREFADIVKEMGNAEVRKKWNKYARHYLVSLSGSEADLAAVFTEARNARARGEVSEESTASYAWILHDCMKQAIDRFKNGKLVELFLSEIRALPLKDFPSQKPSDIGTLLPKDINKGVSFLDGTLEARTQLKQGNIAQAIAALVQKTREQPENLVLKLELIECCVANRDFANAFDSVNYFLTPGHIEVRTDTADAGEVAGTGLGKQQIEKLISTITKYVAKFPRDNSSIVYSTISGKRIPNWKAFKTEIATAYVQFADRYIKGHLDEQDRRLIARSDGWQARSLSERVCECLFRCVVNGIDAEKQPLIVKNGWVVDFVRNEFSLGTGWKCDGNFMVARLELLSGNVDAARTGLGKCIAKDPIAAENWLWFGRTFTKKDLNFARCMCKSILLRRKGFCAGEAHEGLAEYFAANDRKPEQLRELHEAMKLKREVGLRTRAAGQIVGIELFDDVTVAPADEAWLAKLAGEADCLVAVEQVECKAVVVAEKKGSGLVRVYVSGPDHGFFTNVSSAGFSEVSVGMPVSAVFSSANAKNPLKLLPRVSGADWDAFSPGPGVVIGVDRNYGFTRLALGDELIAEVDERHFPAVNRAKIGDWFSVRYEVSSGKIRVYSCDASLAAAGFPEFINMTKGSLKRNNSRCEFGYVDDVFVPGELCGDVMEGEEVTVYSVKVPARRNQKAARQAVKLEIREFKKGGGVVPRG